jgi:probable rRNA maturation factor
MINFQVKRNIKLPVQKSTLHHAAQLTLDLENVTSESSMSVVIGDDALLKKLNQKYLGIDEPTDVLSFPSSEHDPDTNLLYLGDVVISLPRAESQASAGGHPLVEELQLLVVHGTLHLLGYDHRVSTDKKKMQVAQERVLTQLGVTLVVKL